MSIKINDDKELVEEIKKQLKENDGYCPCVLTKTPADKCMCKEFRKKIESNTPGLCHCGLFEVVGNV